MTAAAIVRCPAASAAGAVFGGLATLRGRRSLDPDRRELRRQPACQTDRMTARERLAEARLYLVCDARPRTFLDAALRGGVDIVQLRDKTLDDAGLIGAAREFRAAADAHGALFVLNDRPDLAAACAADGVHVGQDDDTPAAARAVVGPHRTGRRSTDARAGADTPRPPRRARSAGPTASADAPRTRPRRPTPRTLTRAWTTSPSAPSTPRR